jgi:hypothetical protein
MALKDMWRQTPQELEGWHIEKIIAWAGDGSLREGASASNEFREYLELMPSHLLANYCKQCLDEPFEQSALALRTPCRHPLALLLVKTVRSPAGALFVNIIDPPYGRSR